MYLRVNVWGAHGIAITPRLFGRAEDGEDVWSAYTVAFDARFDRQISALRRSSLKAPIRIQNLRQIRR